METYVAMVRSLPVLFVVGFSLLLTGCGPVQAATAISDSMRAIEQAEREGADEYAQYSFYKARAFLDEAKIKNGYGEYEIARQYANQSEALAQEAARNAKQRRDLEQRRLRRRQRTQVPTPRTEETNPAPAQTNPAPAQTNAPAEDQEEDQETERAPTEPTTRPAILPPNMTPPGNRP